MSINQKNTCGDNTVNIHQGAEDRTLDEQAKKVITQALADIQPEKIVITKANDGEAIRYAAKIIQFIESLGHTVTGDVLALSPFKFPDGTSDGQGIYCDPDNDKQMNFLVGYLKKKTGN